MSEAYEPGVLRMHRDLRGRLLDYAWKAAPREACGFLVGSGFTVRGLAVVSNISPSPHRFIMDPREVASIVAAAGVAGPRWKLLGVWHSHAASNAEPSSVDLENEAWPISVIVSVPRHEVRAWQGSRELRLIA